MSFDLGNIASAVVNTAVSYFTGSPLLGQLASNFVSSIINDAGFSNNASFDSVFNGAWGNSLMSAVGD